MKTTQQVLIVDNKPPCGAPCWPIVCDDCPFGDENTTLEQVQEMIG
jgi:hypothetical protein